LGIENGDNQKAIASLIGVSPATVSREVRRNKNKHGGYSWRLAHEMAQERKERLPGNRATPEWIRQKVFRLVRDEWSPKQISGYLKKHENISISHETIYKWIREDKQNGGDLYTHCRHKMKHRKRPVGSAKNIPNRTSIRDRPKEADGSRFNGSEFAAHELITKRLGVPVYFADPYSSWQKGAIENGNKLIRQYIPKGVSFKDYSDQDIKNIQYKLNRRPREKLDFNSPKNEFYKQLM
jgi:IS30 family transposase